MQSYWKSGMNYQQKYKWLSLEFMGKYFKAQGPQQMQQDFFNTFSTISSSDFDRKQITKHFQQMRKLQTYDSNFLLFQDIHERRSIATLLGLAICDALGASTEFLPYIKTGYGYIKRGFEDISQAIKEGYLDTRAGQIGIWTDDCSMALCMADSLISNQFNFNPKHIRYLFILWFFNGLNNGGRRHSIGLGGNIKISMTQFMKNPNEYCILEDRFNNGNGSLMRLAPIPIAFRNDVKKAIQYSAFSSLTTHNGAQAEECCKLLAVILVDLINRSQKQDWKSTLDKTCLNFQSKNSSVYFLAQSQQESQYNYNQLVSKHGKKFKYFNQRLDDRNWNWKDKNFTYSKTREQQKPGYVGSYCMDAMAMALHTIWFSNSFIQVALINANMGGDCDTVGAIAGQIAGAIYGVDDEMFRLYTEMQDFKKGRYQVYIKAKKLAQKRKR